MAEEEELEYYRELVREQQGLERTIHRRSTNIERLASHIKSLNECLEKYRASQEWLACDNKLTKHDSNPEEESRRICEDLESNEIPDVLQALKHKKAMLSTTTAMIVTQLQEMQDKG